MKKVNLDAFKMSKAQMNDVNGGKQLKCVIYDPETNEAFEVPIESGVSLDDAVIILNETYGSWAEIAC
jgi:hypothetical protein